MSNIITWPLANQTNITGVILDMYANNGFFSGGGDIRVNLAGNTTSYNITQFSSGSKVHWVVRATYNNDTSVLLLAGDIIIDAPSSPTGLSIQIDKFPLRFNLSGMAADAMGSGGVYCVDVGNLNGTYLDPIGDSGVVLPSVTISGLIIGSVSPVLTPTVNWNTGDITFSASGVVSGNTLYFFTGSGNFNPNNPSPAVNTITLDGINGWGNGSITISIPQ